MIQADVYNLENKVVGKTELPEAVFGVPWKPALVKQVVDAQLANRRKPWAHAKGRGEVRGGGRKPWRQKGTGRARHGSRRSPIWAHGGVAHGPLKERDYSQKIPKKMKRLALFSALSRKFRDGEAKIFVDMDPGAPKTSVLFGYLRNIVHLPKRSKKLDALIVPAAENKNVFRAAANLVKTKALAPQSLNVYDVLNYKHVLLDQEAIPVIEKHYKAK